MRKEVKNMARINPTEMDEEREFENRRYTREIEPPVREVKEYARKQQDKRELISEPIEEQEEKKEEEKQRIVLVPRAVTEAEMLNVISDNQMVMIQKLDAILQKL